MQGTGIRGFVAGRRRRASRDEMRYEMNEPHEAEGRGTFRRRFRINNLRDQYSITLLWYMATHLV